jgi:hypothetical protein
MPALISETEEPDWQQDVYFEHEQEQKGHRRRGCFRRLTRLPINFCWHYTNGISAGPTSPGKKD